MRHDKERILDIADAIDAIQDRVESKVQFDSDDMLRVWCLHYLTIIGEAASRISPTTRDTHPAIPWRRIVAMRNALVHGYFNVDWNEVWSVVENDLPPLKASIHSIVQEEGWNNPKGG